MVLLMGSRLIYFVLLYITSHWSFSVLAIFLVERRWTFYLFVLDTVNGSETAEIHVCPPSTGGDGSGMSGLPQVPGPASLCSAVTASSAISFLCLVRTSWVLSSTFLLLVCEMWWEIVQPFTSDDWAKLLPLAEGDLVSLSPGFPIAKMKQ